MNIRPALGAVAPPTELGVNTSNLCFVPAEGRFVSPRSGLSCPASDGTRRVAGGRGGGGRRSLTAAAPPDANRRSRSIAQPVFVVARSATMRGGRRARAGCPRSQAEMQFLVSESATVLD